jgi:histidine ammonia-lyase
MIELGNLRLDQKAVEKIVFEKEMVGIDKAAREKIVRIYEIIKNKAKSDVPIYGLNTGFGALAERRIDASDQARLQRNVILSHAVGLGAPLSSDEARAMMFLRLNTLAQGYSGVSPKTLDALTALLNAQCHPFVPHKGSVGASGDLAPLAHLGLLLLGLGPALIEDRLSTAEDALKKTALTGFDLGIRDGLALINGTQAMAARAIVALRESHLLLNLADIAAASTIDALAGHLQPFDPRIHEIKAHPGQIITAQRIRELTKGRIQDSSINLRTQDPYSLRCIPQVHGASKDVVKDTERLVYREINGVGDNPLIFMEGEHEVSILSGGNFHGQYLAIALDHMALAISELANISERRIEQLLNPHHNNGLPAFLTPDSGVNSGYMILHVTASALVNENKVLSHPACTDSIPTSASREDHVSMGMTSANKLAQIIENTKAVLAIELLAAHQALSFRASRFAGNKICEFNQAIRSFVPFRESDGLYGDDLAKMCSWLSSKPARMLINNTVRL